MATNTSATDVHEGTGLNTAPLGSTPDKSKDNHEKAKSFDDSDDEDRKAHVARYIQEAAVSTLRYPFGVCIFDMLTRNFQVSFGDRGNGMDCQARLSGPFRRISHYKGSSKRHFRATILRNQRGPLRIGCREGSET